MLRYLLTMLSTMAFMGVLVLCPKYWGALQNRHLSDPVLGGLLFAALGIWVIFRQLKKDFPQGAAPGKIFKQYIFYVMQFGSLILFFCTTAWCLSLVTHWLLGSFFSKTLVNGLSFFLFCLFAIAIGRLLHWMEEQAIL